MKSKLDAGWKGWLAVAFVAAALAACGTGSRPTVSCTSRAGWTRIWSGAINLWRPTRLLDEWMARWSDIVDFEVRAVISSAEAARRVAPSLQAPE